MTRAQTRPRRRPAEGSGEGIGRRDVEGVMGHSLLVGILVGTLIGGAISGFLAVRKGRALAPWVVYGVVLFPIAVVHLLMLPRAGLVKCPQCSAFVEPGAVCAHCRSALPPGPPPPRPPGRFKSRAEYEAWKAKQWKR
jgi:hypothetical protein